MDNSKIKVFCQWVPTKGFLCWGTRSDNTYYTSMDLKYILFAWHRESFYGSFIATEVHKGIPTLLLTPTWALDFFVQPPRSEFISIQWSEEVSQLQKIAPEFRKMLVQGKWQPDFIGWQDKPQTWRLIYPPGKEENSIPYLNQWASDIINELINEKVGPGQAWESLVLAHPGLKSAISNPALFLDEEDWLTTIGWRQDLTPFRTCLQLVEPDAGTSWTLRVLLQDKEKPGLIAEYTGDNPTQQEPYPSNWLKYMDRPQKDITRFIGCLPGLQKQGAAGKMKTELTEEEAWEFLTTDSLQLVKAGYTVFLPAWWDELRLQKPRLKFKTKSSVGTAHNSIMGIEQLIQFDWKLAIGAVEISEDEFNLLTQQKKRLMKIRGQWIQVDPAFLQKVQKTLKQKKNGISLGEILRMHLLSGPVVTPDPGVKAEDIYPLTTEIELTGHLARMAEKLTQTVTLPIEEQPAKFQGTLRSYQKTGYSWLMFLRNFGLGGCLADDMGLGKTIQFIAYLLAVKEKEPPKIPSLLICPTSVTGNWQMELKKFAPSLTTHLHYGPLRLKGEDFATKIQNSDLVITTYTLAQLDEEVLRSVHWNCICLDEAQNIKNAYTKQAAAIRRLTGCHKIALTGTPMENRLTELWSIMDFLNRGYLGSLNAFKSQYINQIEKKRDKTAVEQVQQLVHPFLLRRMKTDPSIELDLPEKQELKEYVPLTTEQASLYEYVLNTMFEKLDQASAMERRGLILGTLTKLKQVCNHPAMLLKDGTIGNLRHRSNKMERLLEMMVELRSKGDKCLIFTQFVEMGQLLQKLLTKELGEEIYFLHGGTPKSRRDAMVANFQNTRPTVKSEKGIFILSLKAGGTGLNLTAANHVFHFDRWWNPAVENQATDRAHRIGQNRLVQVHKFIALGTLEEHIDEMLESKQNLNELIIGNGESWITEMSTSELRKIFALRLEWTGL